MPLAHFAPILSTPYKSIGNSLDSFDVTPDAWQTIATLAPIAQDVAPIADRAAREVSASVQAWRASYYEYRRARDRVRAGRPAEALRFLAGPHRDYVASRFRADAQTDARFAAALDLVDDRSPAVAPTVVPTVAPTSPATLATVPQLRATFNRIALRNALRAVLAEIPTRAGHAIERKDRRPNGQLITTILKGPGKRLRLALIGDALRVSAFDVPSIASVEVAGIHGIHVDAAGAELVLSDGSTLLKIADLEDECDALTLSLESGTLHVRSCDAHYQLYTATADELSPLDAPKVQQKLTPTAWIDRAVDLAARADSVDARRALGEMLEQRNAKPHARKLAWRLLRATEAGDAVAFAARRQLLDTLGAKELRAWLDARLEGIGYDDSFLAAA